jgi:hypothetical protein
MPGANDGFSAVAADRARRHNVRFRGEAIIG